MIIGFSGRKLSGKSTTCKYLLDNNVALGISNNIALFSFAFPLKSMAVEILGLTHDQVFGNDDQKNSLTTFRWEDMPHYEKICKDYDEMVYKQFGGVANLKDWPKPPTGFMTSREVLSEVGTGIFRKMDDNIWIKACFRQIEAWQAFDLVGNNNSNKIALIDDVRFPNEIEAIHKQGGRVIRFARHISYSAHASESSLDRGVYNWELFDLVIENGGMTIAEQNEVVVGYLNKQGN